MASQWALVAIFLVCVLDAFFPVVPSETTVIAAGALAASGDADLAAAIAVAAAGAFVGDHVSYAIGRLLGTRATARLLPGKRGRAAREWATGALRVRGGLMIVALRFVPGGRTATTFAAGTLEYPLARFAAFAALAAVLWALYSGLVGFAAGEAFAGNHLLAVTIGVGFSAGIGIATEAVRFLVRRRRRAASSGAAQPPPPAVAEPDATGAAR
ncbi:DedA family protein [Streptomonospora sp. PA3]|nr:VTT domain-containing protein [Streptomonospora sp. PA3]MUL41947.1 DedA family protein [Streptomonospora sp. PA3]